MDIYFDLIKKMDHGLRDEDKDLCNYFLLEIFEVRTMDKIYSLLSSMKSKRDAIELIFTALYHLNIHKYHFNGFCPTVIAKRMDRNISRERWFFVNLYKLCIDEEITSFFKHIFNEDFPKPTCRGYIQKLSAQRFTFDQEFKKRVIQFIDEYNIPSLGKYLQQLDKGIEYDCKRRHEPDINRIRTLNIGEYYPIKDDRENLCLVYNDDDNRTGSHFDVANIKSTFEKIKGFSVKTEPISTVEKLVESINGHVKSNSEKSDMIVCCIFSHGENGKFNIKKSTISEKEIQSLFIDANAPTLVGKPKIFIYQVCRGSENNKNIKENLSQSNATVIYSDGVSRSLNDEEYVKDFFIWHSTVPMCKSVRFRDSGSWFIQTLCDLIDKYRRKNSLQEIFVMVNGKSPILPDNKTQLSEVTHMPGLDICLEKLE